jgi:tryptophan halogenase
MALVNQNKSLFTDNFSVLSSRLDLEKDEFNNEVQLFSEYSYQFDATKFGIWLKDNYCKARYSNNFTHILAEVEETPLNDNGIEHLILDNGQKLEADLFIDCTGFKSLLLTEAFGVPFISIENYIPNNYAWATKIPYKDPETQIVNYTMCTAIENGWIWEIPLWSRMGSGYVFSDKFISSEEALKEFKRGLIKKGYENVEDLEYHLIPMRCGIQSKLWVKNTCAIGLAASFIEPLQSNGLHSIHTFLYNLCRILARGYISEWDRKEFTAKCRDDFYNISATVAISYVLTHRDDTEYWREIQNRDWTPDPFSPYLDGISKPLFGAYFEKNIQGCFSPEKPGLHCMAAGMNWNPIDKHYLKYRRGNIEDFKKFTEFNIQRIEERKKRWNEQVKDFPSPYQYLKNNIHKK